METHLTKQLHVTIAFCQIIFNKDLSIYTQMDTQRDWQLWTDKYDNLRQLSQTWIR